MKSNTIIKTIEVLLVEDTPSDVRLTQEAFKEGRVLTNLSVVEDGMEALAFLRREGPYAQAPRPDLILLDLNLPRKNGLEILQEIKADAMFRVIPVIILTTSEAEADIVKTYQLQGNGYITKPVDLNRFIEVIRCIESFWLTIVKLPTEGIRHER